MNKEDCFDLITDIIAERDQGYGFVPLIGNGLSTASGIPTIQVIQKYLYRCLHKALACDQWNPRSSKWPPMESFNQTSGGPSTEDPPENMVQWIQSVVKNFIPDQFSSRNRLFLEAAGALADWRTTLQFLSRLDKVDGEWQLGKPDDSVIDSFFFHITKEKKPNIGHLMLGHLANALRIHTILTTNFDSLLEDAFGQLDMTIIPYDVHLNAELPSPALVLPHRSLIKLHGGRYGLRANYTLDEKPSEMDRVSFCRYLSDPEYSMTIRFKETRKHIFVLGASGNDKRIINLLRFALDKIGKLKIFWICHSRDGADKINKLFESYPDQVITCVHVDCGLFLIQLFQQLYLSPPPGRVNFPAFWPIHPSPYRNTSEKKKDLFTRKIESLSKSINQAIQDPQKGGVMVYGKAGITSLAAETAEDLSQRNECLWLTLDVFYGWNDFFLAMVDRISWRLGIPPLMVPIATNIEYSCREHLERLLQHANRSVVVFLNDREGNGIYDHKREGNGIHDHKWDGESLGLFQNIIAGGPIPKLKFVLLMTQENDKNIPAPFGARFTPYPVEEKVIEFDAETIASKVGIFLKRGSKDDVQRKTRFVYALTLFEHAAYLPALSSWSLIKAPEPLSGNFDNDDARSRMRDEWLKELKDIGAIRYNPGGFVWMHKGVRKIIQEKLASTMRRFQAECHQGIADWYAKLFRSSNDPLAALESLEHRLLSLQHADYLDLDAGCGSREDLKRTALIESGVTLALAKERLLSCGYHNTAVSRIKAIVEKIEVFRKKENFGDNILEPEILGFEKICYNLLRDFNKEIAIFDQAIVFNEKLGELDSIQSYKTDGTSLYLKRRYEEIIYLIGFRCYDQAESGIVELFKHLKLEGILNSSTDDASFERGSLGIRQMGRDWWNASRPTPETLQYVIRIHRRFMFLEMLIAQKYQLLAEIRPAPHSESPERIRYLRKAEAAYILSTELMRRVTDHDFLQTENAYIRTHYGVLLGNLGRFKEAHRRLNEAYGYLCQSSKRHNPVSWAVLYLRRAEVFVQQAKQELSKILGPDGKGPSSPLEKDPREKIIRGYLDDAHSALARVARHLKDFRKNVWWWSLMYELKMTVCYLLAQLGTVCQKRDKIGRGQHEPLACGQCVNKGQWYRNLLHNGMDLVQMDILRQARFTWLFAGFMETTELKDGDMQSDLISAINHLNKVEKDRNEHKDKYPLDKGLCDYCAAVKRKAEALAKNPPKSPLNEESFGKDQPSPPDKEKKSERKIVDVLLPNRDQKSPNSSEPGICKKGDSPFKT